MFDAPSNVPADAKKSSRDDQESSAATPTSGSAINPRPPLPASTPRAPRSELDQSKPADNLAAEIGAEQLILEVAKAIARRLAREEYARVCAGDAAAGEDASKA
jgi:hypothetical protein